MKILINTSNLKKGGALQVAHSLLNEFGFVKSNSYYVVLSEEMKKTIDTINFPDNFFFYNYTLSLNIIKLITGKDKFLSTLEKRVKPNCVLTIFGPSYWKPNSLHIVGFADGWCYNPKSIVWSKLPILKRLKTKLLTEIKNKRIKKEADYVIVETKDAKNKISEYLKISQKKIKIVENTFNNVFNTKSKEIHLPRKIKNEFRLLTVSSNYIHKNLEIIKEVITYLNYDNKKNYRFILTIDKNSYENKFRGYEKNILNIGPIEIDYVPSLYNQSDCLFLPTLLETFSASYPEAMKMQKPILTSNYSFAKTVCQDAALYFDPLNPKDIAEKIIQLANNENLQQKLITEGNKQLKHFLSPEEKALQYLNLCSKIISE